VHLASEQFTYRFTQPAMPANVLLQVNETRGSQSSAMQKDLVSTLIVGMGVTGLSVARFLHAQNTAFSAYDSRDQVAVEDEFVSLAGSDRVHCGAWDSAYLGGIEQMILSPGLSVQLDFVQEAKRRGVEVIGDIELFARQAKAPVIAITGSNGKSTVTDLMGKLLAACNCKVKVGGNIGVAALDLLDGDIPDYYVLELSSFQLETTDSLACAVAMILNITPDHMDRYDSVEDYAAAKFRICRHADHVILGEELKQDFERWQQQNQRPVSSHKIIAIAKHDSSTAQWTLATSHDGAMICHNGVAVLPASKIKMAGTHNYLNVMACMAALQALHIDSACALPVLGSYNGLSHRMQPVRTRRGVTWFNDSKATNVGATIAAVEGISGDKLLIAGGLGKGADFSALGSALKNNQVYQVLLFGKDAAIIAASLDGWVDYQYAKDLKQAVEKAAEIAPPNSSVLFSPACASFDMFRNFEQRGDVFCRLVEDLAE